LNCTLSTGFPQETGAQNSPYNSLSREIIHRFSTEGAGECSNVTLAPQLRMNENLKIRGPHLGGDSGDRFIVLTK
jgi:hypothetical protein